MEIQDDSQKILRVEKGSLGWLEEDTHADLTLYAYFEKISGGYQMECVPLHVKL
ncbi:hypothetical protein QVH35_02195 [Candidatus Nitrosotenuis chungbukensis]|nr:hypothetical protein [Candidatus Nitrosotenuis chungbukensis]WKT58293.1 hypothetical protein QVH35_02195 [Candidatus Nitrosotenuis chungbukensis]